MFKFILKRVATALPTALLGSLIIFLAVQLMPGGIAASIAGSDASAEVTEAIEKELGLDRPLAVQYLDWLGRIVSGDLGRSMFDKRDLAKAAMVRAPLTLELATIALVLALLVGIPLGVVAAVHHNRWLDTTINTTSGTWLAFPEFWLGMLAVNLFALNLAWFPATGSEPWSAGIINHLRSIALPCITLASGASAIIIRFTRSGMVEALDSQYIRTAIALGYPRFKVLFKFALRNALVPVITVVGLIFGGLIGGAVLVESVFSISGIGSMLTVAVLQKDFTTVQSVALVLTFTIILVNLFVDILCGLIDPRIRN